MPRFPSRRAFLITGAALGGTALIAAIGGVGYLSTVDVDGLDGHVEDELAHLNAFVILHEDGRVVVNVPKTEMGQGIHTGLAMLVAEELDIPWDDRISVQFPTEPHPAYSNWFNALQIRPEDATGPVVWIGRRVLGQMGFIATGASGSTMGMWHPMRVAGASARHMLVTAAAHRLGVPEGELTTREGGVMHEASGQRLPYGTLARDAALLPPPAAPVLRPPSEWRIAGRSQPRIDLPSKVRGTAVFGMDVNQADMVYAAIRHAPVFGASVASIANESAVRSEPGVLDVAIVGGRHVAVVAESWWQAEQAAWILDVEWARTEADDVSSADLNARLYEGLTGEDLHEHLAEGDIDAVFSSADTTVVEADYEVPFVTHACMEPMNATVRIAADGTADLWVPTQSPAFARSAMARGAEWAGVSLDAVTCNVTMTGGGFGRRSDGDVVSEAAFLAARMPGRPVKLIWSREEDIARGLFRSHAAARLRAALGPDGLPAGYDATVAAQAALQSIGSRNMPFTPSPENDALSLEGLDKPHYAISDRRIRIAHVPSHLPIHFWRSNGYSFNTFFTESFVDECAHRAGADPLDYRRALLRDSPRHLAVLNRVAEMADWGAPLGPGRGRGIAIESCYRSVVAQVAEVIVSADGEVRVERVFCALDAGLIINPDAVVAQMEGGIIFGIGTALMNTLTIENGAVQESNFHDFPMLRLANAPAIEVAILPSDEPPCGVGEPGVVPAAAAVGNAIFDATGTRLRALPLSRVETVGVRRTRTLLPAAAS